MVGIVIVSHSNILVSGIRELISQMVPEMQNIAFTGGIDDDEQSIGTDPMAVLDAINKVYSDDGVLVIMDLGSALLSAETAIDFLEEEMKDNIKLSSAPIVEGSLSAAIQASLGSDLITVAKEAEEALATKANQLGFSSENADIEDIQAKGIELELKIKNPNGIHARPATKLVSCAGDFTSDITITKNGSTANAKSINQVTTLGIRKDDIITLSFNGDDAEEARGAVRSLYDRNFDESLAIAAKTTKANPTPKLSASDDILSGTSLSEGFAIGAIHKYTPQAPKVEKLTINNTDAEIERLKKAVDASIAFSEAMRLEAEKTSDGDQAEIFAFHKLLLQDSDTFNDAVRIISEQKICADYAWKKATDDVDAKYKEMVDEYFRARSADVKDIQKTVLIELAGENYQAFTFNEPVILVAEELSPSEVANLPLDKVLGICLASGGTTSHASIIASSRGIPTISDINDVMKSVTDGDIAVLDGQKGQLHTAPDKNTLTEFQKRRDEWLQKQRELKLLSKQPAVTSDGIAIKVAANIGGGFDVPVALDYGAEGVGLFRTEFLFLNRSEEPDENEQYEIYSSVAKEMKGKSVIIRTLDIGGDKPVAYLNDIVEDNPFLGLRGIRFTMANSELFLRQLRAILRASAGTEIKIMFPMISSVQEFLDAKAYVEKAKDQLRDKSVDFNENIPIGIMIEVPSAVVIADQLAEIVDFFSIGTNDLTQYVMASDRGNKSVAHLNSPYNPSVLRMIKQTTDAAHKNNIHVGMCGAFAGDSNATELLIGLGLDELSMNAPLVPAQKLAIKSVNTERAKLLAEEALNMTSADEVKELIKNYKMT